MTTGKNQQSKQANQEKKTTTNTIKQKTSVRNKQTYNSEDQLTYHPTYQPISQPKLKQTKSPLISTPRLLRILHNDADERVEFDDGERPIDVDVGGAEESDDRLQIRRRFVEIGAEQIRRRPQDPSDDDHRRLRRRIGHEM